MLTNVRESANYTCVASSDLGNIEANAQVKVKGNDCASIAYSFFDAANSLRVTQ